MTDTGPLVGSAARLDAAAAMRALGDALLLHDVADDDLAALARRLDELAGGFRGAPPRRRSFAEIVDEPLAPPVLDGGAVEHFDQCFVTGAASPCGLAARTRRVGAAVELTTRIPVRFEGMPGFAHGGILAAVFDDVIGLMTGRLLRIPAPTVRVEIDFRRPVPLDTTITFRAGEPTVDGRKYRVVATATVGDTVHAVATGLLVTLSGDQLAGALGADVAP